MSFPYNSQNIGNRIFKPDQSDAVERLRVSNPQSLIDTDFEYSLQSSKWETLELMNNIPSFYSKTDDALFAPEQIIGLSGVNTIAVSVSTVPAVLSNWPDPRSTKTGPLTAGWTVLVEAYPFQSINSSCLGSYRRIDSTWPIIVNGVSQTRIGVHGGGAITIGPLVDVDTVENWNTVAGVLTGSVLWLNPGSTGRPGFGYSPTKNIYSSSAYAKRELATAPLTEFNYYSRLYNDILTIINDGSLTVTDQDCSVDYVYPLHTSLRRAYHRLLDVGLANERRAIHVFSSGPGISYWSSTDFRANSGVAVTGYIAQNNLWGKEPSWKVVEIYRNQPRIDITTMKGTSGLESWTESNSGPVLNRSMFTKFGVTFGTEVLYNEGNHSTATSELQGSAKIVNYGGVKAGGGVVLRVSNVATTTLTVGQPIVIDNSAENILDGTGLVVGLSSTPTFTDYTIIPRKKFVTTAGRSYNTANTNIYAGGIYTNSPISFVSITPTPGTDVITVTTPTAHNMFVGQPFFVVDPTKSDFDLYPWIGSFVIDQIISSTTFTYRSNAAISPQTESFSDLSTVKIYVRPEGLARHRSIDGGVQINTGNNSPYTQVIRQTRNYFRYQSGKSILFSTGLLFKPLYDVDSFSVNSTQYFQQQSPFITLTIRTEQPHGFSTNAFLEGPNIRTSGFSVRSGVNRYNDTFKVNSINDDYTFTVNIPVSSSFSNLYNTPNYVLPSDLAPGGNPKVEVRDWNDCVVRSGMFDEQNGIYFECDGRQLSVALRTSTLNLAGTVSVSKDSTIVTGTNTKFLSQLQERDYIVIRGMSYVVTQVLSDSVITISPKYSGVTNSGVKIAKTAERIVNQADFNLDKLDGTGASGYVIDLNKMQMIYFDYSWYGAGRIRWGVRATNGDIIYCHEMPNNNVNTEAYMRSGNLPARFEIFNKPKIGKILQGSSVKVSAGNTLNTLSAISVVIKKGPTPAGPFGNFSPPISGSILYQNIEGNTGYIFNLSDYSLVNTGNIKGGFYSTAVPTNARDTNYYPGYGTAEFTNLAKYGTSSIILSASSRYGGLDVPALTLYKPGLGQGSPQIIGNIDFCVEGYFYMRSFRAWDWLQSSYYLPTVITDANPALIWCGQSSGGATQYENNGWSVRVKRNLSRVPGTSSEIIANFGDLSQYGNSSVTQPLTSSTKCFILSTWHHVAFQRYQGMCKVFVDGVPVLSAFQPSPNMTYSYYYAKLLYGGIGGNESYAGEMRSFISSHVAMQGLRGVFGSIVYDPNGFVPPTLPLTTGTYSASTFFVEATINRDISANENNYYKAFTIPTNAAPTVREVASVQTLTPTASTILVSPSASFFLPNSGTILMGQEYINYTKIATKSTGEQLLRLVNRNVGGLPAVPQNSLYAGNTYTNITSINNNVSPALSHWGTSVIMDGEFNQDKSYLFTASMSAFVTAQLTTQEYPLISIRLAPSADYGIGASTGIRSLINRSIITLNDIQVVTRQANNIVVKLNCESPLWAQPSRWSPAGNGSISQYMDHSLNVGAISGGVVVAGFFSGEQDINRNQVTNTNIDIIRTLGNSILGGDGVFPDGPDILTVFARPFVSSPTNRTLAKVSWLEAQG